MSAKPNHLNQIAFRSIVSLLCCLVLGYMFYQSQIFNRHAGACAIPVYGLIGSIFFYTIRVNVRNAFAALLVLFFINSAFVTHATRFTYVSRDFLLVGALSLAIYIFQKYFYARTNDGRWREPLILAGLLSTLTLLVAVLSLVMFKLTKALTFPWVYYILKLYFVIGLGIGCGIMITEEPYISRIRKSLKSFLV